MASLRSSRLRGGLSPVPPRPPLDTLRPAGTLPGVRTPVDTLQACADHILPYLKARQGEYVTPGWVWDRQCEYTESLIAMALKRMKDERKIDGRAVYGVVTYAWLPNLEEVLTLREAQSKKKPKRLI
jgi:hypothetical protein